MDEIILVKPFSVNKAWQGRRFKTQLYKDFEVECLIVMRERKMIDYPVRLKIVFYVKYPKMLDGDNLEKPFFDIMVKKGWLKDDRLVYFHSNEKKKSVNERIEVKFTHYYERK